MLQNPVRTLSMVLRQSGTALRGMLVLTILCGLAYPLLVLGVGQVVAHDQAAGSLLTRGGRVVGSSSLGQDVTGAQWFQGRRSASDYSGATSGGSNLAVGSKDQQQALATAEAALVAQNPHATTPPPAEALTASGSGLDPDISPAYAQWQVARVAAARGLSTAEVSELVAVHTKGRLLGFLGEPRVNVTEVNLALADLPPRGQ